MLSKSSLRVLFICSLLSFIMLYFMSVWKLDHINILLLSLHFVAFLVIFPPHFQLFPYCSCALLPALCLYRMPKKLIRRRIRTKEKLGLKNMKLLIEEIAELLQAKKKKNKWQMVRMAFLRKTGGDISTS